MKLALTTKIIAASWIAILVLGGLLAWKQTQLEIAQVEREQAVQYSLAKDDSLVIMKTTTGQLAARSNVLELTIRNLERLQADRDLQWLQTIEGINKRMNNIEEISTTTAHVVGTFKIPLQDTTIFIQDEDGEVFGHIFDNQYEWFRLRGITYLDTLIVTPEVPVPLQSVVYWERRQWPVIFNGKLKGPRIGRKEWYKQTTSPNPYVTITEDKLIRVTKKKRK